MNRGGLQPSNTAFSPTASASYGALLKRRVFRHSAQLGLASRLRKPRRAAAQDQCRRNCRRGRPSRAATAPHDNEPADHARVCRLGEAGSARPPRRQFADCVDQQPLAQNRLLNAKISTGVQSVGQIVSPSTALAGTASPLRMQSIMSQGYRRHIARSRSIRSDSRRTAGLRAVRADRRENSVARDRSCSHHQRRAERREKQRKRLTTARSSGARAQAPASKNEA